ncbi:Rh-like protein/ammonium transporter [Testicularia cyperi]|uniref:Rh-like protein/ammonium transporter n=1 Tax=Testicularia cyperi TaxID=1882483 RepID=A0A317XIZ4_9BASI|nr:Rh-like protein/ammonium transporter [Testicularia cyperi]
MTFNITTLPEGGAGYDIIQTSSTDPTVFATYKLADMVWVICATAFVWPMIPAIGFLYSGLSPRRSASGMLFQCFSSICVVSFQWWLVGYSLAYSGDAGGKGFIGDLARFGLMNIESATPQAYFIPEILYAFFQLTFAAATVAIAIGGAAGRARMGPLLIWQFFWVTFVYCPLAHWVWSPQGWIYKLGTLDYAGGTPVHVASGTSALALSLFLSAPWRPKASRPAKLEHGAPWNPMHILFATIVLWAGWIGFDGAGGNVAINIRSVMAASTTNLSAAVGAMAWSLVDLFYTKKFSIVAACSGAIAGLVGITPACGYVGHPAAALIGLVNGVACNYATKLKHIAKFQDPADVVGLHLVGGIIGNMMTGLFAQADISGIDGVTVIAGGAFLDGNWIQIGYQLADTCAAILWSFSVSFALLAIIDLIPGCKIRASDEDILAGTDLLDLEENFLLLGASHSHDYPEPTDIFSTNPAYLSKLPQTQTQSVDEKHSTPPSESSQKAGEAARQTITLQEA